MARFSNRARFRVLLPALATVVALVSGSVTSIRAADENKQLQRVKGVVGYQQTGGAFTAVVSKFLLPDDYDAVTREKSAAILTLPDSSIVALGENTDVQVGAFNQTATGPGSTITVNNGTLRFDIRRPAGGTANFHFATNSTQIAVRGTVGLISVAGGNTTVACVVCAADSVTVTVGTQSFVLLTGQLLTVTAAGAVAAGVMTSSVLGTFSAAGVSTSASTGAAAATAGVTSATAAAAGATTAAAAGAAAAVAAAAAVVATQASPAASPTAAPTGSGAIGISDKTRPAPSATPPVPRPTVAPLPAVPPMGAPGVQRHR